MLDILTKIFVYFTLIVAIMYAVVVFAVYLFMVIKVWLNHEKAVEHSTEYDKNPSVTVIVPAYNEEVTIVDSVKSTLLQDYENLDIIIINDGSKDNTLQTTIKAFNLKKSEALTKKFRETNLANKEIYTTEIKAVYQNGKIILVDKENGGKASALNVGVLNTSAEYCLCVDADTFLVKDAVSLTLKKKRADADAVSCMVGILNGNEIVDGQIIKHEIPKKLLPKIQWLEYVRSYVLWSTANDDKNLLLVISGAFAFLRRDMILKAGGYKANHLAEDMELTMNILSLGGKIQFISEFLAWTEVPETLTDLTKQRLRWYQGGVSCILQYRKLAFHKDHQKRLTWYLIPFVWFSEVLGPWVELLGWIGIILTAALGYEIDWQLLILVWSVILFLHCMYMTLLLVVVERKIKEPHWNLKLYRLAPLVIFEVFTYHFINLTWLLRGHTREYRGVNAQWNKFERKGFSKI